MLLLIAIIILILIALYTYSFSSSQRRPSLSSPFPFPSFLLDCGEEKLRLEDFKGGLVPSSTAPIEQATVRQWWTTAATMKGKASKLAFDPGTTHPVGRWLEQWWLQQIPFIPLHLQERLKKGSRMRYTVRFTSGDWRYPNHFDCVDNIAVVLVGERKVVLDRRKDSPLTLKPQDILYIPMGQEHEFWCDTAAGQCNVLFNVNLSAEDDEKGKECNKCFSARYPDQQKRVEDYFEYS